MEHPQFPGLNFRRISPEWALLVSAEQNICSVPVLFMPDLSLTMNRPLQNSRRLLCAALILIPALIRAQTISDAFVSGLGVSWVGSISNPVIVSGSGFAPGNNPAITSVKFNGTAAGFSVVADGQINVTSIPVGATSGLLSVTRSNLTTVFSPQVFQIVPGGPYVTSFNPVAGSGGTVVTMTGVRLGSISGTNGIFFNGKKASAATITSATEISATAPPGVTTGLITVMSTINPVGTNTTTTNFFGPSVIVGFNPPFGRSGTNVIITGTNFTGATSVLFNGLASSYVVNSNTQITATVPASATTGTITVTAPGGGFATSSNFVMQPTLTTFAPAFGAVGTSVTINGANFNVGTPIVTFNGVTSAVPTSVTFNSLVAVVPAKATTGPIRVLTADGTATSLTLFYLPPVIASFSPTNSAPGTTVTINGTNFTDASAVKFNGTTASFFNVLSNSLQVTVPNNFTTGPLTVITPGGTNTTAAIASSNFYAAPIITSFSPSHGLPGTNVTIFGTNFLGTTSITFNGLAGTSLTVLSNTAVRITVPVGATTGLLAITAPAGVATTVTNFVLDYTSDLAVTVTNTPNPVTVFDPLTYSVAVKNRGPHAALSVMLTNALPASVTLQSDPAVSQGTWATNGNLVIASFGTLSSNAIATLTLVVTPQVPDLTLTDLASALSGNVDPVLTNNAVTNLTFVEPLPLLSVGLDASNAVLLSWSSSLSNFALQFNPELALNNWSNVLTAPVSGGGSNVVTETNPGPLMFYRLKR